MSLAPHAQDMPTFLLATSSVHTSAAACDYLTPRLEADDTVMVLGVDEPDTPERDIGDAINVARARLAPATVWTERREGEPSDAIDELAADVEADEIVIGQHRGDPEVQRSSLGETARTVAGGADRPIVVVPPSETAGL